MALRSRTQQLEKRITELKQFVDLELSPVIDLDMQTVSLMTSIRQTLDSLDPSVSAGTLNLRVIAEDQALIDSFASVYHKHPTCKALYSFEAIALSQPERITFGDVIVGLVHPGSKLTNALEAFIEKIAQKSILKFFLIVVLPGEISDTDGKLAQLPSHPPLTYTAELQHQLHKYVSHLPAKILLLRFETFLRLPETVFKTDEQADKENQASVRVNSFTGARSRAKAASARLREHKSRVEKKPRRAAAPEPPVLAWLSSLEALAQQNADMIACQPITNKLLAITSQLMDILSTQKQQLTSQLNSEKSKISTEKEINVQQQVGIAFRQAEQKIDDVLGKSREDVSTLKGILLDPQDVRSIKRQLQQQIDSLQPVVEDLKGKVKLELVHHEHTDIHQSLVALTGDFLNSWSKKAWRRIFDAPHRDGLQQLCNELPHMVHLSPALRPRHPEVFQSKLNPIFNIQHLFNSEFKASFTWCRRYKFPVLCAFIMKDLRTNLMAVTGFVMLISYVANMFLNKETSPPENISLGMGLIHWGLSNLKGLAIFLFFPVALKTSMIAYHQDKEDKQEAEVEKLLQEGSKHYQTIAIAYVNKFVDFLNTQLNEVEHSLKYELNEMKLAYNNTLAEVNKKINRHKLGIKQVVDAQKRLRKIRELI